MGFIGQLPHALVYAHAIAIAIAFTLITCLHVILGELVPKSLALQRGEQVALAVAAPMDVFLTLIRPASYAMSHAAGFVLRMFGSPQGRTGPIHSPDELKLIATASRQVGQIPAFQEEMIHSALELENITVREVMVPRPKIFSLPGDLSLEDALTRVVEEQHSRVPVYDPQSGPEHIVGILYSKDLMYWTRLRLTSSRGSPDRVSVLKIGQIMREVLVVPETKILTDLLEEFKERKRHIAIVVDEFGSTAGLITAEDVLEQLVGEIEDEFDVAPPLQPALEGQIALTLDGATSIRDLESQYDLLLPSDGFETLAGFILTRLQKIPQPGATFEYEGCRFTVEEMEGLRIAKVKIERLEQADKKAAPVQS
jgi:CBS domain containing-hemolysin-like protein